MSRRYSDKKDVDCSYKVREKL